MMKRRGILSGVLTLVLVLIGAWALGFFHGTDPAIAELQDLSNQMRDSNLADAQRNQLRTDFRQRLGSLSEEQRRAFFDANRNEWNQRTQQRMDEYFAMSKADQQKRLDEILNRIAQAQKSQQQNANGQGNRGAGNGRGGGRNMTDAQRQARSKQRLDNTTPKQRAQFAEFRKQLDTRAQQRGIQLGDQRGRGGFGGFGGFPRST
jgi:hypothetical protein